MQYCLLGVTPLRSLRAEQPGARWATIGLHRARCVAWLSGADLLWAVLAAQQRVVSVRSLAALAPAICGRLDGLPLAIKLAAARMRHLPPEALLERLERPLASSFRRWQRIC